MKKIEKGKIVLLNLAKFSDMAKLYREWAMNFSFVGVLSTRLSYSQIIEKIGFENASNLFVIDCVSKEKHTQSVIIDSLSALTSMSRAVSALLNTNKAEIIIVDSLSALCLHNKPTMVLRFANDIANKCRQANCSLVLPIAIQDMKKALSAAALFADRTEKL